MAGEADFLEMSLIQQEDTDFGGTIKIGQVEFPCSLGTLGFSARLVPGGISSGVDTILTVRKSVVPSSLVITPNMPLTAKDKCGIERKLKIASGGVRDCLYAWELTCDDQNQNA